MTSPITYHVLPDNLTAAELDALLAHLVVLKPRNLVVQVAAKREQALAWSRRVKDALPPTRVIRRLHLDNAPDDGRLARHKHGWDAYAEIAQYAEGGRFALYLDNEPGTDNLYRYAQKTAEAMDAAGREGVSLVVGGFSTATPHETRFEELEAMWRAFARWPGLHVNGPHIYDPQNADAPWHFMRPHWGLLACDALGLPRPETMITEFGVAFDSQGHRGWHETGWSAEKYVAQITKWWKRYYEPFNIDLCIFSAGAWPTLADTNSVGPDFWRALETNGPQINETDDPNDMPPQEFQLPDKRFIVSGWSAPPVIDEPDEDEDDTQPVDVPTLPIEEEKPMKKINVILAIALVAVLLLVGGVVTVLANVPATGVGELLAQSVPTVADTSGPISTEQGRQFIEDITNTSLIGGAVTGALVMLIVQGLKFVPIAWLQRRTATDMATGVATIFLLAGAAFSETSYAGTFDNSVAFMESIAPLILGLLMAVTTSGGIFNGLKRVGASEASFFGKRAAA